MSRAAGRPKASEARLGREQIEDAALALLSSDDTFSMRALAARLAVSPMAIYHHVGGREALLGALADRVLKTVSTPGDGPPRTGVAALLNAYCTAVLDHPALFLNLFTAPGALEGGPRRVTADLDGLLARAAAGRPRRTRDVLIDYTHGFAFAAAVNGSDRAGAVDEYRAGLDLLLDALLPVSGGTPARR